MAAPSLPSPPPCGCPAGGAGSERERDARRCRHPCRRRCRWIGRRTAPCHSLRRSHSAHASSASSTERTMQGQQMEAVGEWAAVCAWALDRLCSACCMACDVTVCWLVDLVRLARPRLPPLVLLLHFRCGSAPQHRLDYGHQVAYAVLLHRVLVLVALPPLQGRRTVTLRSSTHQTDLFLLLHYAQSHSLVDETRRLTSLAASASWSARARWRLDGRDGGW